jgi:hypothetical protein
MQKHIPISQEYKSFLLAAWACRSQVIISGRRRTVKKRNNSTLHYKSREHHREQLHENTRYAKIFHLRQLSPDVFFDPPSR